MQFYDSKAGTKILDNLMIYVLYGVLCKLYGGILGLFKVTITILTQSLTCYRLL